MHSLKSSDLAFQYKIFCLVSSFRLSKDRPARGKAISFPKEGCVRQRRRHSVLLGKSGRAPMFYCHARTMFYSRGKAHTHTYPLFLLVTENASISFSRCSTLFTIFRNLSDHTSTQWTKEIYYNVALDLSLHDSQIWPAAGNALK